MPNKVLTVRTCTKDCEIPKLDWFITNEIDYVSFLKKYNIYSSEFSFLNWNTITDTNIKLMEDYLNTLNTINRAFLLSLDYWTIDKD